MKRNTMNGAMHHARRIAAVILTLAAITAFQVESTYALTIETENSNDTVFSEDGAGTICGAGQNAELERKDCFSYYGAGYNVGALGLHTKDALALAGYDVAIVESKVGSSAFLAGYDVKVTGSDINGNITATGYSVTIDKDTSANSVIAAAESISMKGSAKAAKLCAKEVTLGGHIDGDVSVQAENVHLEDDLVVTGTLKIEATQKPSVPTSASIGTYSFFPIEEDTEATVSAATVFLDGIKSALYWAVAMMLVGLLLCWLANDKLITSMERAKAYPGRVLGTGIITMLAAPLAIVVCCITVIGLPLAGITAIIYFLLCFLSLSYTGASLSRLVFKNMHPLLASLLGIAILEVVVRIPYLGFVIRIAAAMFLFGSFVQMLWEMRWRKAQI